MHTVNKPRGPAAATMDLAAPSALGYTPACTDRMHTAIGTFTTDDPAAAIPPPMKAIAEGDSWVWRERELHASP